MKRDDDRERGRMVVGCDVSGERRKFLSLFPVCACVGHSRPHFLRERREAS
jgi:hypothetical protein